MAECFTILLVSLSMRTVPRLFVVLLLVVRCYPPASRSERAVLPLDQTDELVVITINSPDTYYENADGAYAGLEFDLASEFARDLGMKIRFKIVPKLEDALVALEKHHGHIWRRFQS